MNRILRFKGFSDPIHESEIFNNSPPDPDWGAVRFNESLESINYGYYSAIDEAMASIIECLMTDLSCLVQIVKLTCKKCVIRNSMFICM